MLNICFVMAISSGNNSGMEKGLLVFLLLLLITSPLSAQAGNYENKGAAGDYTVVIRIDKNPPGRGNNNMAVYITDRAQQPVTDARVKVNYLMPSLPGRPPMMNYNTEATLSGDHYLAKMNLSMAGKWSIILGVSRAGKSETVQFSFVVK
jgi:hypothetical protein